MASDSESTAMRFHDDLRKAVEPIILHFIAMGLPVLLVWAVPILVDRLLGSEATLIGVLPLLDLVHAGGPAGRADGPSPRRGASTRDRAPRPSRGPRSRTQHRRRYVRRLCWLLGQPARSNQSCVRYPDTMPAGAGEGRHRRHISYIFK
jgi:hypothetical protein